MSDVDTMAGYLITALGTIPDEGKTFFEVGNIKLTAEEMEGTRLLVLRVHFYDEETVDEEPEENRRFSVKKWKMTNQDVKITCDISRFD